MGIPGLMVVKRLRMEGFIVMDYFDTRAQAEAQLAEGRLKAAEDLVDGLERAPLSPLSLAQLFQGRNRGKLLVRVS